MDIENEAFEVIWLTISLTLASILAGPILSFVLFKWINTTLHPSYDIIRDERPSADKSLNPLSETPANDDACDLNDSKDIVNDPSKDLAKNHEKDHDNISGFREIFQADNQYDEEDCKV